MAVLDLTEVAELPWKDEFTAATTWQEVRIPIWCNLQVTSSTALYLGDSNGGDPASATSPADGGAVGARGKFPVAADAVVIADRPTRVGTFRGREGKAQDAAAAYNVVFIAAQSGTPVVYLEVRQALQGTR